MAHADNPHDASAHVKPSVYLSRDIPGTGGLIKQHPEDFLVEEIPAYQPCGEGEHIYLFVQKKCLSTHQLVTILARHFNVREQAIGFAGMKDRHAVTRQVVSIHAPGKVPEDFPSIPDERVAVLWSDLHTNKLRRGHLKGNRFSIRIRGAELRTVLHAQRTLELLAQTGVPNRTGEQRFGITGRNHLIGRAIILGDFQLALDLILSPSDDIRDPNNRAARELYTQRKYREAAELIGKGAITERRLLQALSRGAPPERAIAEISGIPRSFYLSGFQSAVFNAVLDRRLTDGTFGTLRPGDLAFKHDNGSVFALDESTLADPSTEARLRSLEISPSGPIWGPLMLRASGTVDDLERETMQTFGVTPDDVARAAGVLGDDLVGQRRALRIPLLYPEVDAGTDDYGLYVRCGFELPAGSFATVVMEEVMKRTSEAASPGEE